MVLPMNELQKQCCLAALGFYPHREIDGIWGPKSKAAMYAFEAAYPGVTFGVAIDAEKETKNFWPRIRYFQREEFRCKCGGKYCDGFPAEPSQTLVELLEDIREEFGLPVLVSSGVRCTRHNAAVEGVSNSRHLNGTAADIMVLGVSGQTLLNRAKADPRTNYCYIIGSGPYVHIDVN